MSVTGEIGILVVGVVWLAVLNSFVVLLSMRWRHVERRREWQQLGSVYEHQERRIRGDG